MQRTGTSLAVRWLRLHTPNARGPGLIFSQGARFHILQLRGLRAATKRRFSKISYAISKVWYSHIYLYIFFFFFKDTGNRLVVARGRVGG